MALDRTRNLYANARHAAIAVREGRRRLSSPDVDIRVTGGPERITPP